MIIEKFDFYKEYDGENKSYFSHVLFDSYNRFLSETDEIYDYLPKTASKTYNCLANNLINGTTIGKTKLLIEKTTSLPHIIKYIYLENNEKPVELHEYHSQHHSGLIYRINLGKLKITEVV